MIRSALLLSLSLCLAPGCNGSDCNKLAGAVVTSFNLDFSRVAITKQLNGGTFTAMILEYINENVGDCAKEKKCPIPVKVVANAPVEPNTEHDLIKKGALLRVMPDMSQFQNLDKGFIKFDGLGGDIDGEFYGTFIDGSTINGDFCGGVIEVNN